MANAPVTWTRYHVSLVVFHVVVATAAALVLHRWRDPAWRVLPARTWLRRLAGQFGSLAVLAYVVSLLAPMAANADDLGRLKVGAISGRLMAQALFGEAVAALGVLAWWHLAARRPWRAAALVSCSVVLLTVYVDAFHVEPNRIVLRRHATPSGEERSLRILHLSDIQAPRIGEREERALVMGLAAKPDLIVLTGDYVQDALGEPTEEAATAELRDTIRRVGFDAPLGVYATDGDAGPQCMEVFAGTHVRCLVDASVRIPTRGGQSLGITGLSRTRGRERDPAWFAWLLGRAPQADYRLVISHAPDFVDALPQPIDLALAGHTHGGQVVIPFFGPPITASRLPRRYAGGMNDFRGTPLHVSRGIGMERGFTVPVRFLCAPEVCVIDLPLRRMAPSFCVAPNR